jgi:glycerate-2-kinase
MSKGEVIQKLFFKALDAVKADNIVKNNVTYNDKYLFIKDQKIAWSSFKKLYIFSVGKAGFSMAKSSEKILGKKIDGGMAISLSKKKLRYMDHCTSTHPIVSTKSIKCANKLIKSIKKLDKDDLFIFFLSGGASALIEKPVDGLSLKEFQKISRALIVSGIDIKALNRVRKSISNIKGGKLAKRFKAKGYVLVLSDVIGDDLNSIGSAPMYGKVPHFIIGNNKIALESAKKYIKKEVQKVKVLTTKLSLTSSKAADLIAKKVKKYDEKYDSYCLLLGGETTVQVQGDGLGGRNSELALRLLLKECIGKDSVILCAGSDGVDGNSPANGAYFDFDIYDRVKKLKLEPKRYLENSDSHSFFKALDSHFITGITGTNVMDFVIVLKVKS